MSFLAYLILKFLKSCLSQEIKQMLITVSASLRTLRETFLY